MQTPPENTGPAWSRHAERVARKVNLGWWLQALSTPLVVTGLAGACALLLIRRSAAQQSPAGWVLGAVTAGVVLLVAGICWLVARRKFEKPDQSLVRIEAAMKLRNGLSAARAGVAPWPEVPAKVDAGLNWSWQRVVVPPVAAICFLTAGIFIPLSANGTSKRLPDEPQAWQKIEADLQRLEEDKDVLDEAYIEEVKKQLNELKAEDQENWFSHSSLEATDSLKQSHASEVEKLDRELGRAEKAISALQKENGLTPGEKQALTNQLDQALQNLQSGALKPNSKLMDQLKNLDPKNLGQMDPEKMKQLKESMQKAAQAAKDCKDGGSQPGDGGGNGYSDELNDGNGKGDGQGEGEGEGNGQDGSGPGSGGVNRGPGHSPGMLGKEHDKTKTGDLTGVESKDLSHALPGDLLELQDGEHDVDKSARGPQAGGAAGATGAGGDRVWKESLDPSEQKALKKFFE
ncbi:MAG: hypothetical protein JWO82_943 [Akkermansiaceae bacterium]|nr:hypothetical protein [Akkermansiaceae bacterium]